MYKWSLLYLSGCVTCCDLVSPQRAAGDDLPVSQHAKEPRCEEGRPRGHLHVHLSHGGCCNVGVCQDRSHSHCSVCGIQLRRFGRQDSGRWERGECRRNQTLHADFPFIPRSSVVYCTFINVQANTRVHVFTIKNVDQSCGNVITVYNPHCSSGVIGSVGVTL